MTLPGTLSGYMESKARLSRLWSIQELHQRVCGGGLSKYAGAADGLEGGGGSKPKC